jgi:hypothetical protein
MGERYVDHLKRVYGSARLADRAQQLMDIHRRFHEELALHEVTVVDLLRVMRDDDYYLFDGHWRPSGHRKAAEQLAARLGG